MGENIETKVAEDHFGRYEDALIPHSDNPVDLSKTEKNHLAYDILFGLMVVSGITFSYLSLGEMAYKTLERIF